jgi:hypothetical protein
VLPDRWTGDLSLVWSALHAAWGHPRREAALLDWLERRTPGEWARLDEGERRGWIARPGPPPDLQTTLAHGWRSFAADGRVRERAVRALAEDPSAAAVGFLLVRCDDWVLSVRVAARTAILARAAEARLDLERWMPLLLARDARSRSGGLVDRCVASAPGDLAERLLQHTDARVRRWALTRVLAAGPDVQALQRLLAVADPPGARLLARRLAEIVGEEGLYLLLADRRAWVRRAAWERVVEGRLPDLDLRAGLLDAAPTIRALAQQAARLRGIDAREIYLAAPTRTAAERRRRLVGLGEWGAPEAAALAHAALDDPDQGLRLAAIAVLALRAEPPDARLLDLLRTRRGVELRAVERGLLRSRVRVGDDVLALLRAGEADQRKAAWRLGRARGRWERLLADLLALGDDDDRLADAVATDLNGWYARVMATAGVAPRAQLPMLVAALADARRRGHALGWVGWVLGV